MVLSQTKYQERKDVEVWTLLCYHLIAKVYISLSGDLIKILELVDLFSNIISISKQLHHFTFTFVNAQFWPLISLVF